MKLVEQVQSHLQTIYDVNVSEKARDYLITKEDLGHLLPDKRNGTLPKELFLVNPRPANDTLEIALFFDDSVTGNLKRHDPMERLTENNISDFCTLIEGVSHFVYYLHKAELEHDITELEMELQAEIDKFVLISLCAHANNTDGRDLLELLFEGYELISGLSGEQRDRYHTASQLARKYCYELLSHLKTDSRENFIREIRSFYPLRQAQKIQHILS